MKETLHTFYSNRIIFYLFIILVLLSGFLLFTNDKLALQLLINSYNNSFFDVFFKYATYLGDGIIFPIVIVGLLIFKRDLATTFILSALITLIISYVLKNWVFIGFARPYEVLGEQLHLIKGVKMRHWHSFPSGHTTSAFALFMLAIFYTKKIAWQMLFFLLAILAGFSRIYLSQHFLQDVLGGAILGTSIALVSYQLAKSYSFFKKKSLN